VIGYAHRLGIESELEANMSLALGAAAVSPLEMAVAFATIDNGGKRNQPIFVTEIYSTEGQQLEEFIPRSQKVADPVTCYLITDILRGVVEGGTGVGVRSWGFSRPCAGKTGTSSEYRDTWFVGFTPELVAVVWVGFDDNRPMRDAKKRGLTGARAALPIWTLFMKNAMADAPYSEFPVPPGIVFEDVDPRTGSGPMPGGPSLTVAFKGF
ncbi:carboxypeptidase, partial [candidate division KSB1 bacterium]|nr:carboxypeptidase [candidate division KSB1 bacterium]